MAAAAAEAASVLFTLGYNNIIFVSLYNFSSRNLQGVILILVNNIQSFHHFITILLKPEGRYYWNNVANIQYSNVRRKISFSKHYIESKKDSSPLSSAFFHIKITTDDGNNNAIAYS